MHGPDHRVLWRSKGLARSGSTNTEFSHKQFRFISDVVVVLEEERCDASSL